MSAKDRRKDKRRYAHLHGKIKRLADIIYKQDNIIKSYQGPFWSRLKMVFTKSSK